MTTVEQVEKVIRDLQKTEKYLYLSYGLGDALFKIEASPDLSLQEEIGGLAFMLFRLIAESSPTFAEQTVEDFKKNCLEELNAIPGIDVMDRYTLSSYACSPDGDSPFLERISKQIQAKTEVNVTDKEFILVAYSQRNQFEAPNCRMLFATNWEPAGTTLLLIMRATLKCCTKIAPKESGNNLKEWESFLNTWGEFVLKLYEKKEERLVF